MPAAGATRQLPQCAEAGFEDCWVGQDGLVGKELQASGLVGGGQPFQQQAPEEAREHSHGQEKAGSAGNPMLAVGASLAQQVAAVRSSARTSHIPPPRPVIFVELASAAKPDEMGPATSATGGEEAWL
jgi:hypothetical protein